MLARNKELQELVKAEKEESKKKKKKQQNNANINTNVGSNNEFQSRLREQESKIAATTVTNNINQQISKNIVQGTFQNDVRTKVTEPVSTTNNQIAPIAQMPEKLPTPKKSVQTEEQPKKKWYQKIIKGSKYFEDGYQFGDITKAKLATEADIAINVGKGFLKTAEGIGDTLQYLVADKLMNPSDPLNPMPVPALGIDKSIKASNAIKKNAKFDSTAAVFGENKKAEDNFKKDWAKKVSEKSVLGEIPSSINQGIGNIAAFAGTSAVTGGSAAANFLTTFASAYGNSKSDAYANGADDSTANKSAIINGMAEAISEQVFDGIPGVKSAGWGDKLTKKVGNGVTKYFGTKAGKIGMTILESSGEGFEEIISNMLTATGNDIAHMADKKYTYGMEKQTGNILKDLASEATSAESWEAFLSASLTSAIVNGASSTISNVQRNKLIKAYAEEQKISFEEAKNRLTIQLENNNQAINENTVASDEKYSMPKAPMVLQYQETDNQKINNLRQSAVNEKMINNKKTQEVMNIVETIIADKDYNVSFDSTITNDNGKSVAGKISLNENGETDIKLNPNSDRAVEFLLTHEITHAIETKELKQLILDYAKRQKGFDKAIPELQQIYQDQDVSSEVVADISAQVLGNQEFINSLQEQNTQQSRGMIKTIYESIKRVLNKLTTKGRYRNFVQDLETKWREAYNIATKGTVQENLKDNSQFSTGKLTTGEDIVISDDINGSNPNNKVAEQTLKNMLGIKYINDSNSKEISIEKKDIKKYLNDGYHNYKNSKLKKRIAGNYGEVIELAKIDSSEPNYKNTNRGKQGYDYYNANLAYPIKDAKGNIKDYKYYEARLVVRKDNNNNFAYDLDNFKEKKGAALDKSSLSITAGKPASSSFSGNNISQSNKNVKSDTSTKYSMQSKGNNTQELDNSSFSYRGSHQIENAKSITDLDLKDIENKIIDIDGYLTKQSESDLNKLKKILKSTNDKVKIYRASPVNELNSGDWVTTDKSYAKNVANENGGKVYEYEVDPKQLYYPDNIKDLPSLHKLSSFQYVETSTNETSTTDSQGRTLSKEQQEYFKDSKIRNENGNLKVMYHGTKNGGFTIFDRNKAKTSGNFGTGIYFSSTMDYSNDYIDKSSNSKMYEVYLSITNPVDSVNKSRTLTNEQVKKLVETIANNEDYGIENYGYNATIDSVTNDLIQHNNDFEIFQDLDITCVGNFAELVELANKTIGTTFDGINTPLETVAFYPNQIKSVDNTNPTTHDDIRYSQKAPTWQEHLEKNYKSTGTKTYFDEMRDTTKKAIAPIHKEIKTLSNEIKELKQEINSNKQSDDLIKISKMNKEEASTTPKLPRIERNTPFADKESSFYSNVTEKSKFLSEESRKLISTDSDVKYYSGITNEQTMDQAYKDLQKEGKSATSKWFNKQSKDATAIDVAKGWILLKQYQDAEDYGSMVEVAKKMREIGTTSGQTVQAFNILSRLTPEGMVNYAQSELTEAYNQMVKNKTKNWIDKHRSDFELSSDEAQFIVDNMKEVQDMDDGYEKRVKLAEIQKLITDKLPTEKGRKIKSWMRISMLFNPKTQVRNVMGNALIAPVNYFGDIFASVADRQIAKKTGVRTTGNINVKAILKGFKDGAYQATNDYKKGINTRDMEGNRFEIGEGKSFSEKNLIGKSLNRVDGLLNYVMDIGDRIFSQSSFENSLQNQMKLNNTNEITQDMIDIARTESLQRTWNDNNNYTKFVLDIRRGINKMGIEGYGIGDVLIPYAKTPANLTKAIIDYSPIGLVKTIKQGVNLSNSLSNGQYNTKMQHDFVQKLGKATAGSLLFVAGLALAKTKITSGESDDDKDVANFMKNTLGINSYSIKIGDKSFTYDWAQPLAAPLAITANIVNKKYKNKDFKELMETIIDSLDTGGSILLEQSFLQSINDVLKSNDGVVSGLVNEILELPARTIPTFSKQIADMVDNTQRQTYVKGKPVKTAMNSAIAKIPGASKKLTPVVDTMGRNIKKYGGKNNAFNVLLNPANVNTENISSAAKEVYKVYQETDDKTIFPRVAPYSIDKIPLSTKQRADYQTISGELVEKSVNELIKNDDYKDLSNKDKAVVISKIVGYNSAKAKSKVLKTKMSRYWNSVNRYVDNGGTVAEYYLYKVVDD